jgi:hypothetical protein
VAPETLARRLRRADQRWEKAMAHKDYPYPDDPDDPDAKPFTPAQARRFFWADAWRREYHVLEEALYQHPRVRAGLIEGLCVREPSTTYTG